MYEQIREQIPPEMIQEIHNQLKNAVPILEVTPKGLEPIKAEINGTIFFIWIYRIIKGDKIFRTVVVTNGQNRPFSTFEVTFFRAISYNDDEIVMMQVDPSPQKICLIAEEVSKVIT